MTQAVRRRSDASWRPRDLGGVTQAVGRRRDASGGGGTTQAAVAAYVARIHGYGYRYAIRRYSDTPFLPKYRYVDTTIYFKNKK